MGTLYFVVCIVRDLRHRHVGNDVCAVYGTDWHSTWHMILQTKSGLLWSMSGHSTSLRRFISFLRPSYGNVRSALDLSVSTASAWGVILAIRFCVLFLSLLCIFIFLFLLLQSQFVILFFYCIRSIVTGCEFASWLCKAMILYSITLLVLFCNFFLQAYVFRNRKTELSQKPRKNNKKE